LKDVREFPYDPSTYWVPCLSSGYSPVIPPFNLYVEYIKTGENAFTIPAGQKLAKISNEVVEPFDLAKGVNFKAIAPLKPGIYNISVIVYDDAETGLYWVQTKQIRVVSYLPRAQIAVSEEDFPVEEVWARATDNNVTMIRRVLVTNYQGFNDTQVSWYSTPLPIDAVYISGATAGVIDYLCDGCTENPSNITYVVPGVVYIIDKISYDSTYVELGGNVSGKVSFYVYDKSKSTSFTNVKVNISELLPYDSVSDREILIVDRILPNQYLFYQVPWTSRTGYEVIWSISQPTVNYVYEARIYFYNNNSKDIDVWYKIPLVRLPAFDSRNIVKLAVDGNPDIGFFTTSTEFVVILRNMTAGEHEVYLEYYPYTPPTPSPGLGGGVGVLPVIKLNPKEYNYTGRPTNLTIWYTVRCEQTSCAVVVVPSGPYSKWVEIPHESRYGWTRAGFLAVPKDADVRFPVYVNIPEATPDGRYNITIIVEDISTRVQARGIINITIARVVIPPIDPRKLLLVFALVVMIFVYINRKSIMKYEITKK